MVLNYVYNDSVAHDMTHNLSIDKDNLDASPFIFGQQSPGVTIHLLLLSDAEGEVNIDTLVIGVAWTLNSMLRRFLSHTCYYFWKVYQERERIMR
jgi:hypothetical protein